MLKFDIEKHVEELPGGKRFMIGQRLFAIGIGIMAGVVISSLFFIKIVMPQILISINEKIKEGNIAGFYWKPEGEVILLFLFILVPSAIFYLFFFIVSLYLNSSADKIFRKKFEKSDTKIFDANQLKAQKARIVDFLSKLDERFIIKELSDNNYKELKSKYETQLKNIQTQIVETELHE